MPTTSKTDEPELTEGNFRTRTIYLNEEKEKTVAGMMTLPTLLKTSTNSPGSMIRYKP